MLGRIRALLLAIALILSLGYYARAACPPGDVHEDCEINALDLQDLAARWLDAGCIAPGCPPDLGGGPGVNSVDFALLAGNWGIDQEITLLINEFMSDNERTIEDPDDPGDYADWIEIYNYGDDPINIAGMYITDHPDRRDDWKLIPAGGSPEITTIPAGGFLLIWPDGDPGQGPLHVDFGLGRGGDEIAFYDTQENLIDHVVFGPQLEDYSRGRLPNGSGNWEDFEIGRSTPGTSNRARPVQVMINEIMYHPYHAVDEGENLGEEYIELYNDGDESVDLAGWRFIDGVDFVFPDIAEIAAKEHLVIASDVNAFEAKYPGVTNVIGGWVGRLSNSGEDI